MTTSANPAHLPGTVLIVGAGPVGLSAALLLARSGVRCTVLEREPAPSGHPKARGIRPRTMELFAQWGIAEALYAIALPDEANRFIYCESLAGPEIARTAEIERDNASATLARTCRVAQDSAQAVLRDAVAAEPLITMLTGVSIVDVDQSPTSVNVVDATGHRFTGDYLIAADGAGSTVRKALGSAMIGDAVLGYGQSIYWRGDLRPETADRLCIQFHTTGSSGRPVSIASVDGQDRWVAMVMQPASAERPVPPTHEQARDIIREAVGRDITPEIVDIATWRISAQVADHWRQGRVFLAGDAAHTFPPTGGFGMNTGIQDAHNLAWKLVAVLRGDAPEPLLDSYELERRPVAVSNAAWSAKNGARFRQISAAIATSDWSALDLLIAEQASHVDASDQDLAFRYADGAVGGEDPHAGSPLDTVRLGCRFPQMWMRVGGRLVSSQTSAFDGVTLVVAGEAQVREAESFLASRRTGGRVAVASGHTLADGESAIIRPDGIVGWYGNEAQAWPAALDRVFGLVP